MSTADRWKDISALYAAALACAEPERDAFLEAACAGDDELRRELTSLLACHADAQDLMAVPALRLMADALAADTSSLVGHQLGPYRIDAPLAAGGMGEVYRATDMRLHRTVAIKILPAYLRESAPLRRRFEREAQAVAALRHPHICVLHDIGRADDIDFLVLELLDGETIADRLARGPLPLADALQHAGAIADALVATHRQGIVHRDLKPGNVMLTEAGAKLLDFGLATLSAGGDPHAAGAAVRATTPPRADSGTSTAGTLRYMTPEQLDGKEIDHRSDVFAFGVLLYEMVTGRRAFDAPDPATVARAIREREPAALPPELTTAAPGLDSLIRACLQKDPARRWQQTQAMADAVRHVAAAVHTSRPYGARGPWLIAAAFSIVVAITVWRLTTAASKPAFTFDFDPVQITATGDAGDPALSPDGSSVAYVRGGGLWVAPVSHPDQARQVVTRTAGPITRPAVTRDGRSIDFLQGGDLWRASMNGGPPTKILEQVSGIVGYAPDGRRMAFIRNTAGRSAVMLAAIDGSGARELVARSGASGFGALPGIVYGGPRWSPNGRVLAVPHYRFVPQATGGTRRAGVVFLDPTTGQVVNEGPDLLYASPLSAEWIDDESLLLVYGAQSGPPVQFWRLSYPGNTLVRLQNDVIDWVRASLSADRRLLAAERTEFRTSIWVDGAEEIGLSTSGPTGQGVEWSGPDVVHVATAVGRPAFLARHVLGQPGSREFVFSDASSVFVNLRDGSLGFISGGRLWTVDRNGGNREPLMSIAGLGGRPALFDRTVLFRRSDGTLWRADVAGGDPVTIRGIEATGSPDVSSDGRFMAFSSIDDQEQPTVVVCELPDCTNRRSTIVPAIGRPPALTLQYFWRNVRFTAAGDVSYLDRDRINVWTLPRAGGEPYAVTHFGPDRRIADFAWSRDGHLAVSRFVWTNDVVLFTRERATS